MSDERLTVEEVGEIAGRPGVLPESATEAVAEAWASIDGKLDGFRAPGDPGGLRAGYMADAEELIRRVGARGVAIVPLEGEGFDAAAKRAAAEIFARMFSGTSDPDITDAAEAIADDFAHAALRAALAPGDHG